MCECQSMIMRVSPVLESYRLYFAEKSSGSDTYPEENAARPLKGGGKHRPAATLRDSTTHIGYTPSKGEIHETRWSQTRDATPFFGRLRPLLWLGNNPLSCIRSPDHQKNDTHNYIEKASRGIVKKLKTFKRAMEFKRNLI